VPPFEGIAGPVQSYVDIWYVGRQCVCWPTQVSSRTPLFHSAIDSGLVPGYVLKWGHGAAMSSVLLGMGVVGAWLGWQIRFGNGGETNALTLGGTIRDAHPKVMGGAFFFFLLGGQGGLVLLDTQGGSILESPHAITALIAMSLLAIQVLLPFTFKVGGSTARSVHAYLGAGTILALFAHLATGIQLGLSL
jgi:Protein of unknown function (DUF4079)